MSETITTACGCQYAKDDVQRKVSGCKVHPMATPAADVRDRMRFGCGCVAESKFGKWVKIEICAKHREAK